LTDRGKGSYWTVNDNVDPRTGVHRVRKKKPKARRGQSRPAEEAEEYPPQSVQPQYENPTQYVPAPPMDPNDPGPSRPGPYPPPYPPFDPAFPMMGPPPGMRFPVPPPPHVTMDMEEFELDEHGNVDWHLAWVKELAALQQLTSNQEKAGVDPEWYRQMLFRVRAALMMGLPPDHMGTAPPPPPLESTADGSEIARDGPPPA
jgi:forkhead box protein J2/3